MDKVERFCELQARYLRGEDLPTKDLVEAYRIGESTDLQGCLSPRFKTRLISDPDLKQATAP